MYFRYPQLFIILICLFLIGCYTMIQHPNIADYDSQEEYEYRETDVDYLSNCSQCHTNLKFHHPYTNYYTLPNDAYDYYDWEFYYDTPWWDNYHSIVNEHHAPETLPPTQPRTVAPRSNSDFPVATGSAGNTTTTSPTHLSKQSTDQNSSPSPSEEESSPKRTTQRRDEKPIDKPTNKSKSADDKPQKKKQ